MNDDTQYYYNETAEKLLKRLTLRPFNAGLPLLDEEIPNGIRPGTLIEIVGGHGQGKTEILLQSAITCILPSKWMDIDFGGNQQGVIYFDNDSHLETSRLIVLLEFRILKTIGNRRIASSDIESLVEDCLKRFFIIRCLSSLEFLMSLKRVTHLINSKEVKNNETSSSSIKMLMIDNIGSFYWLDRQEEEIARTRQKRIYQQIYNLINDYSLIVLATKPLLRKQSVDVNLLTTTGNASLGYRDNMPSQWTEMVQYRFILLKESVKTQSGNTVEVQSARKISPNVSKAYFYSITEAGVVFESYDPSE